MQKKKKNQETHQTFNLNHFGIYDVPFQMFPSRNLYFR